MILPTEGQTRADLLKRVRSIRDVLAADTAEAERIRTLPAASVAALQESGLYGLKAPRDVGGSEASLATQLAVFEEVAYINPSAGWNLFISSAGLGLASAFLPDEALPELFAKQRFPTFTSGGGYIPGRLVPVKNGYRLSGRWIYGSGVRHAEWSCVPAQVEGGSGRLAEIYTCVVPTSAMTVHDTWHVMGLAGTGSNDYSVEDLFVPTRFTFQRGRGSVRGGAIYRLGPLGFVTVEIVGFMLGVARRALDELIALAKTKSRGYLKQTGMVSRSVLQNAVAQADLKLKAARALNLDVFARAMEMAADGSVVSSAIETEMRAAGTMAAGLAIEVGDMAFRYGAGTAMRLDSMIQRCLRDLHSAGTHFLVSDSAFELHGQHLLGLSDVDPIG